MRDFQGKLIVLYGVNNIGKTTQANLLRDRLEAAGKEAVRAKAPLYNLKPSGPMINAYLRENNPEEFSPREAQMLFAFNRIQYQPYLLARIELGEWVVFEDYWATGVAWGTAAGMSEEFLTRLNMAVHEADLSILMTGKRFKDGIEKSHHHEGNDELTKKAEVIFLEQAKKYNWPTVDAAGTIEEVHERIWKIVSDRFALN